MARALGWVSGSRQGYQSLAVSAKRPVRAECICAEIHGFPPQRDPKFGQWSRHPDAIDAEVCC